MKIVFVLFIAACVAATAHELSAFTPRDEKSGTCGNISWAFNSQTYTLTISGTGKMSCCNTTHPNYCPWTQFKDDVKTLEIQEGVTSIDQYTCYYCINLKTVKIPAGVTSIGKYAFRSCTNLTEITFPSSLTSIGSFGFDYCESLKSITIPPRMTTIVDNVFHECVSLKSVNIQSELKTIGSFAFCGCKNLTTINIPSSVTTIADSSFGRCESLKSFTFPPGLTKIYKYSFASCSSLNSVVIPSNVTVIAECAFEDCKSLTSITIPPSVTEIYESAFQRCESLTSITFPPNVSRISNYTFYGCKKLKTVNLPSNYSVVGWYAFRNCSSLTSFTLPSTVKKVYFGAFLGCTNLKSFEFLGKRDPLVSGSDGVFAGCDNLKFVCVPSSYDDDSFCGREDFCKHDSCESIVNNQCYENPVCSNGTITMDKRKNATDWESKSNGCYEYQCDRDKGPIYWKQCNNSGSMERVCENDQCIEKYQTSLYVEISVEDIDVGSLNMTELRKTLSSLTNVEESKLKIQADVNDKGEVVHIKIMVDDETTANTIKDKINEAIDNGNPEVEHFKKAEVKENGVEPSSGMMNEARVTLMIVAFLTCFLSILF